MSKTGVPGVVRAFAFDPVTGMVDLGTFLPSFPPTGSSRAFGINDAGDIVGEASFTDNQGNQVMRAFLVQAGTAQMIDLGTLVPDPGAVGASLGNSKAFAISNSGMIVGMADTGPASAPAPAPAVFQPGGLPRLLFPSTGAALGLNDAGTICGRIGPSLGFTFDAATGATDLSAQFGPGGPTILSARGINSAGQVVASAQNGSLTDAVLLTP
jgi:probable HAF family extracellular repeat protein